MKIPTIEDLIGRKILPQDEDFISIVEEACQVVSAYFAVFNLFDRQTEFVSSNVKQITGYEAIKYIEGGAEFIFSTGTPKSRAAIMEAQGRYIQEVKQTGFDPRSIIVHEYVSDVEVPGEGIRQMTTLGVVLTYTTNADMQSGVAFGCTPDTITLDRCRDILERIKKRHNEIYVHPVFSTPQEPLKRNYVHRNRFEKLTTREEQVLKFISDGLTTAQIADRLDITDNTVETHRRNLLTKFESKNMAEVIQKASKLYWLE